MFLSHGAVPGLIADFALRLSLGLCLSLLSAPWRQIPPRYFRTLCLNILALMVLACFDLGFGGAPLELLVVAIVAAAGAYAATVAWGLGLARIGQLALVVVAFLSLTLEGRGTSGASLQLLGRVLSAWVLGASLAAMLLGHHYLTAPAMSVDPLKRMIQMLAAALLAQAVFLLFRPFGSAPRGSAFTGALLVGMRWCFGIIGPAIGVWLAWRTAVIRSTQSATGILYAVTTLIILGELAGLVLSRG